MSTFTSIDLSKLPPPSLVEELDYESILAATKNELQTIAPELDVNGLFESDPISKLLQIIAYRELHLRQRINEAARGVMLATASGSNLDHLAALVNVWRLPIPTEGDEPQFEDDERLRARTQLAFEGFSTAGPEGAYIFHAISASQAVKDVTVYSLQPGEVEVCVLSHEGDGRASDELVDTVAAVLNADEIRPLTDWVKVRSAEIVNYSVEASLVLLPGVGGEEVRRSAKASVLAFMEAHRRLGVDITRAGLISALYQNGVQNVILHQPARDILIARDQVSLGSITGDIHWTQQAVSVPDAMPEGIQYDKTTGVVNVLRAKDELTLTHYRIYWGGNNSHKLPLSAKVYPFTQKHTFTLDHDQAEHMVLTSLDGRVVYMEQEDYTLEGKTVTAISETLKQQNTQVRVSYQLPPLITFEKDQADLNINISELDKPTGATHVIVFSVNEFGEMPFGMSASIR